MQPLEELLRLRQEARKLRKENANANRSWHAEKKHVDRLEEMAHAQQEKIKTLEKENDDLKKENATLKSRLGISLDHAKKLAGMIFKLNVRKHTEGTGNNRGALHGHQGVGRKKPDHSDQEVDVFLTNCYNCGNPLERTVSVDERVVEDIPQSLPIVTKYHIERQWCTHCHKEVRGIPRNTVPRLRFGMGIVVLVLFLKYRLRTPLAKIVEVLQSHYKLSITDGGVQELLHTFKTKCTKRYNDILEEIRNAPLKHADETSWRIDGTNGWCWLFATPQAALYTIEETRGKGVPERIFGHDPTGVLVRDDYAGYASLSLPQQSCWAHLLRVSHEAVSKDDVSPEMLLLHGELKQLFAELDRIVHEPYDTHKRTRQYGMYEEQIDALIERTYLHEDAKAVQTRIRNQRTNLITALLYENVPLTNNHAERMIRPMVITRKISGGSRSDKGAATHAVNMSIMQTLSLRGKDFFEGIREILHAGNPRYALGNGG